MGRALLLRVGSGHFADRGGQGALGAGGLAVVSAVAAMGAMGLGFWPALVALGAGIVGIPPALEAPGKAPVVPGADHVVGRVAGTAGPATLLVTQVLGDVHDHGDGVDDLLEGQDGGLDVGSRPAAVEQHRAHLVFATAPISPVGLDIVPAFGTSHLAFDSQPLPPVGEDGIELASLLFFDLLLKPDGSGDLVEVEAVALARVEEDLGLARSLSQDHDVGAFLSHGVAMQLLEDLALLLVGGFGQVNCDQATGTFGARKVGSCCELLEGLTGLFVEPLAVLEVGRQVFHRPPYDLIVLERLAVDFDFSGQLHSLVAVAVAVMSGRLVAPAVLFQRVVEEAGDARVIAHTQELGDQHGCAFAGFALLVLVEGRAGHADGQGALGNVFGELAPVGRFLAHSPEFDFGFLDSGEALAPEHLEQKDRQDFIQVRLVVGDEFADRLAVVGQVAKHAFGELPLGQFGRALLGGLAAGCGFLRCCRCGHGWLL